MKPANNSGPTDRVLDEGLEVEAIAQRLGITEEAVRRICRDHAQEIASAMRDSADDLIFELAHHEGLVTLGEPEIPVAVLRAKLDTLEANETRRRTVGQTIDLIDSGCLVPYEVLSVADDEEPVS